MIQMQMYQKQEISLEEEIKSKRADEITHRQALPPIQCGVLTLFDVSVAAGRGIETNDWEYDAWFCTNVLKFWLTRRAWGWTTPRILGEVARSVREEEKTLPVERLDAIAKYCEELDPAVLILFDDEPINGVSFRGYFSNMQREVASTNHPRADLLLREFLVEHGDRPVRPVHRLILPDSKELWAAVILGPTGAFGEYAAMTSQYLVEVAGQDKHCCDYCYNHVSHRDLVEIFIWRFETPREHHEFIQEARRAVAKFIANTKTGEHGLEPASPDALTPSA
jgi:hypothetical protein